MKILNNRNVNEAIISISIIIIIILVMYLTGTEICLLKKVSGIPCPGCGMTRAIFSFLKFNIKEAFFYHPLFLLPFIWTVVTIVFYIKKIDKSRYFLFLVITIIIFISTWILRLYIYFPDGEPMKYYDDSVIGNMIKFIKG